jgi:hypothetical protein
MTTAVHPEPDLPAERVGKQIGHRLRTGRVASSTPPAFSQGLVADLPCFGTSILGPEISSELGRRDTN